MRAHAERLDAEDLLGWLRERFTLPDGVIYLDGNSLGALPKSTPERLADVLRREWGEGLVRSWNDAGWWTASRRVAGLLAPLLGVAAAELAVADSTSVNLFKLIVAGARLRPGRDVIVAERGAFPTDLYIARGAAELLGARVRLIDGPDGLGEALGRDVALAVLSHVDFRTGAMWDAAETTGRIQAEGALALWDLCHSAGAVPVDLHDWDADLAVGCGYKYLNGGPGAPAYCYVARRHHGRLRTPLPGWHGHAEPFAMSAEYAPGAGVAQLANGTPPMLSLLAFEEGLRAFADVDTDVLFAKGAELNRLFAEQVRQECPELELASPARRGSQTCFRHPKAFELVAALAERGVIGDFRAPDIARFGFAPAYLRYVDAVDAVAAIRSVLDSGDLDDPRFADRPAVT
jgi:kynureninase